LDKGTEFDYDRVKRGLCWTDGKGGVKADPVLNEAPRKENARGCIQKFPDWVITK